MRDVCGNGGRGSQGSLATRIFLKVARLLILRHERGNPEKAGREKRCYRGETFNQLSGGYKKESFRHRRRR